MAVRLDRQQLFQYSYRRGIVIFLYGLIWLVATIAGYLLIEPLFGGAGDNLVLTLIVATWSAALAGAMGGATAMLSRLYRHVSIEQDFQHQSLALYFIQPFTGTLVGILVLYLIIIPGALLVNLVVDPGASLTDIATAPTFVALQILLAWIAGFHQELGLKKLRSATGRFIPTAEAEPLPIPVTEAEEPLFFREWYRRQQQVRRWSFTWGVFILGYGLLCLIGLLFSALVAMRWLPSLESGSHIAPNLILAAWPIAVAGGMGGVLSMLRNLYEHASVVRDFDRQHLMSYLVQPVLGAVFGFVIYFLLTTGFLTVEAATSNEAFAGVVEAPVLTMIQLVLGWVAGFRNQFVAGFIDRTINRIVTFIKVILKLLHPKNLFSKERRNEILAEVRGASGPFHLSGLPRTPAPATDEGETISDWFTRP